MTKARAMVLAAGRGERMRPLTDATPKPLLAVRGKPLLQWPLESLAAGGFSSVVVNTAWLGEQIEARFGNGAGIGSAPLHIVYSHEGRDFGAALETAGGITRALPMLGEVFWVVAGDVYAPAFVFSDAKVTRFATSGQLAHLWLVPNPSHHPKGDFGISAEGLALDDAAERFTFSTIALYRAELFAMPWNAIARGNPLGERAALASLLRAAITARRVSAEIYDGDWTDVGTPQRLAELNLKERSRR